MKSSKVSQTLYRSLLKIGRRFDESPSSKALLFRVSNTTYHEMQSDANEYYDRIMSNVFVNDRLFLSPSHSSGSKSFVKLIRDEFRKTNVGINIDDRVDIAFIFLKKLSNLLSLIDHHSVPETTSVEDSNENDTPIESEKISVELASTVTPGTILIAHPLVPGPLHRSVVLLLGQNLKGSYGIVINKNTRHTISSSIKNISEVALKAFGHHKVNFGGVERRFQVIHDMPDCDGVPIPLSSTMFSGGSLTKLIEKVDKIPDEKSNHFHFYIGSCWWSGQDLKTEVETGCWIPVSTNPDQILNLSWKTQPSKMNSFLNTESSIDNINDIGADFEEDDEVSSELFEEEKQNTDLWSFLLKELGPKYKNLSTLPSWVDINSIDSVDWK